MSEKSQERIRKFSDLSLYLVDIFMLALAFWLGYEASKSSLLFGPLIGGVEFSRYIPMLILQVVFTVTIFYLQRMYHQRRSISRIDLARNIIALVTVSVFLVNGVQEAFFRSTSIVPADYPRRMLLFVWLFSMILIIVGRELHRWFKVYLRRRGYERDNLLIVGLGRIATSIADKIIASTELGYNLLGLVDARPTMPHPSVPSKWDIIGSVDELDYLIDRYKVAQVIIVLPDAHRDELVEMVAKCRRGRVDVKVYPDVLSFMSHDMSVDELGGIPLITVRDIALRGWKLSLKRGLDVAGSLFGLVALSPFMLLTGILIRLESPGPVFYTQERMGLDGRPFHMIKFRSMRSDAEQKGVGWTTRNDDRVTRLGPIMRKTSWDEIPQLINVFLGEMSLVGPRPERPYWVQQFRDKVPRYMERHREKAGMTGWAQVNGMRGDTSIEDRTAFDLWYVENWSLWLDIKIIIRTVLNIVLNRDQNAY